MAADERKSSEDLIKQARSRITGEWDAPESTPAHSGEPSTRYLEPQVETDSAPPAGPDLVSSPTDLREQVVTTPAQSSKTRPFFTSVGVRLVVAILFAGGWWLFTSLDDASRDGGGEIVGGGDLDVMTLQTGDCFEDPAEQDDVVFDVAAVPCSEPHDNEVFAVESVAGVFGDAFPGQTALQQHSYDVCSGPIFDTYVGTPYLESSLEVFSFTPTQESWGQGDRDFVCALYSLDLAKLNGSARNSGL